MAATTFSLTGLKMPATRCPKQSTKFNLAELQRALKNMSLASVEVGKHLVVMNRQFDATIGGGNEPGIAFMVLFNLESGVFLKRIWNLTVGIGRAFEVEHFLEACESHFSRGRPCPGFLDRDAGRLSVACSNILSDGAESCAECQRVRDGEKQFSIRVGEKRLSESSLAKEEPSGGSSQRQGLREWARGFRNIKVAIKDEDCFEQVGDEQNCSGDEPTNDTDKTHDSEIVIKSHPDSSPSTPAPIMPIPANVLEMLQTPNTVEIKVEEDVTGTALSEEMFQGEVVGGSADSDGRKLTYAELISEAIENSDKKALPLSSIYAYISKAHPQPRSPDFLRHQLSADGKFQEVPRKNGKGCYWVIKGGRHDIKQLETAGNGEFSADSKLSYTRNVSGPNEHCAPHFKSGLPCDWCDLKFPDDTSRQTHLKQKHLWGKFRCTKGRCTTVYFPQDIVAHMENHEHTENVYYNEEPYVHCPSCRDTILIKDIVSHYEQCVLKNSEVVECPSCHKTFENNHKLNRHWIRDHVKTEELRNECNWCGKKFTKATLFFLHMQEKHLFGIFFCRKCPFEANFAKDLIEHMDKEGHGDVPIQCPSCKIDFTKTDLETHYKECITKYVRDIRRRKNRTLAKCKDCGKIFKHNKSYIRHLKTHLRKQGADEETVKMVIPGSKNKNIKLFYYCDKCDKKFTNPRNLRNHCQAEHEGKVYKCNVCSAIFRNYAQLTAHKRIEHSTGEKYTCKFCGKRCSDTAQLKSHERCHKDPEFQCSICAKRLKSEVKLEAHERAHRGEKPFPCSICGVGFTSRGGLGQHTRGVHKIIGPQGGKAGWIRKGKCDDIRE